MRTKLLLFLILGLILSMLVLGSQTPARAATQSICVSVTGGGNWSEASTWLFCSTGSVPTASDDVYIQGPVTLLSATTAANVSIGSAGMITTGSNLLTANNLTINAGGAYDGGVLLSGNLSVAGSFHNDDQPVTVNGATNIDSTGSLVFGVGTATFVGPLANSGFFAAGSATIFQGDVTNQASGTFSYGANTIILEGNLTNSGAFVLSGGQIVFAGSLQNLTAQAPIVFWDLTVNPGTTLVETVSAENVTVNNMLINHGVIRKSQSIPSTGVYTFGLAGGRINGARFSLDVTADNFTSITLDSIVQDHPSRTGVGAPPQPGVGWGWYWHIAAIGSGTANVTLPHNVPDGANAQACRYIAGAGGGWDCSRSSSTANTVTRNGVNAFSDWAVGYKVGPTAVGLSLLQGRSLGVELATLGSLLGLALLLSVSLVVVRRKRSIGG